MRQREDWWEYTKRIIRSYPALERKVNSIGAQSVTAAYGPAGGHGSTPGRPVARHLDDGWTLEVNRLCTDGTRNACSMLYAAAWRAARAMGYKRLIPYILDTESGTSLRAAG